MPRKTRHFLAFDLGAESGRGILARFDGERLDLSQIHRFANGPVPVFDHLYWDALRLFAAMQETLALYRREHGPQLDAIGVDTWGVDFALLGRGDILLENPRNYRDPRTDGMLEAAFARVPREQIFAYTGIQFMKFNTLYQLLAMGLENSPVLEAAETFLMMPDLFNFFFTGRKVCEFSNATTTQFYDPRRGDWASVLLERLELPGRILPQIVPPGTILGPLLPAVAERAGINSTCVIAPATHDTGSAVVAVPASTRNCAYISSGTWSLMGVELDEPRLDLRALQYNFTNEGGAEHTFRLLKNIMGLWLVQECRRAWEQQGQSYSYAELTDLAARSRPFLAHIEPDDESFLPPGDMPARVRAFCEKKGQTPPADPGATIRVVLESLALKYRYVFESLEDLLERSLECIHMVGGGIQNQLLCQFTANACGCPVFAGPLEATAIGNVIMQAIGNGDLATVSDGRQVVRNSFDPVVYEPADQGSWNEVYERFTELL